MKHLFDKSLSKSYRPFVFWCIYFISFSGASELARRYGLLDYIYNIDNTKISVLIASILVWKTLTCGKSIHDLCKIESLDKKLTKIKENADDGWLWSDLVTSLGMIGTVVGFIVMLSSFESVNFENTKSIQEMIKNLSYGMSTALSTTLVGLVASVLLKVQYFKLDELIKSNEKKLSL